MKFEDFSNFITCRAGCFRFFFVVYFARSVEEGIKKNASENRLIKGWVGGIKLLSGIPAQPVELVSFF